ncbi:hypothetical protein AAGR22_07955 [Erwinia sp. HDF1-3R]|uniref:hypothetical protein n=1 Tax=Erwinia sp. HDF1-3R TaxID=3141543 RepID=UPI0031F4BAFB
MSAKNHIWPAYVDMMTVLLLVYVLLNVLLSVVITQIGDDDVALVQGVCVENQDVKPATSVNFQYDIERSMDVNNELYVNKKGDFILNIKDKNSLSKEDATLIKEWLQTVDSKRQKVLFSVYLPVPETKSVGSVLRTQAILYYEVLQIAALNNFPIDNIINKNSKPGGHYQEVIKMRIK